MAKNYLDPLMKEIGDKVIKPRVTSIIRRNPNIDSVASLHLEWEKEVGRVPLDTFANWLEECGIFFTKKTVIEGLELPPAPALDTVVARFRREMEKDGKMPSAPPLPGPPGYYAGAAANPVVGPSGEPEGDVMFDNL